MSTYLKEECKYEGGLRQWAPVNKKNNGIYMKERENSVVGHGGGRMLSLEKQGKVDVQETL